MRRKRAASFRDKSWKEISFSRSHQSLHLLFRNCALQNRFADAKCAIFGNCCGALADKGIVEFINLSFLTNRTNADRFVLGRVDLLRRAISIRTKIEFQFKIVTQFYCCVERSAHFTAESLQWTNSSLGQKLLYFRPLKQPASHCLPNNQAKRSTFKRAVIFIERTATALWAFRLQSLEITTEVVAFEVFRLFDDLTSELPDVRHELLAFHGAFLHKIQFVFPFTDHFRRTKLGHTDAAQQCDQRHALCCRDQIAALPGNIAVVN